MDTLKLCSAVTGIFSCIFHSLIQLRFLDRHTGRADAGYPHRSFIGGYFLQCFLSAVTEIVSCTAMEMDVNQTGDGVPAMSVDYFFILKRGLSKFSVINDDIPLRKCSVFTKNLYISDNHSSAPSLQMLNETRGQVR